MAEDSGFAWKMRAFHETLTTLMKSTVSLFVVACCSLSSLLAQEKLNFVFFLADDLGYMDVGFNNPETFYETPHLDGLAKSGMVFTDFHAACQVCSPTRASIFTGKSPARLQTTDYFGGQRKEKFDPGEYLDALPAEETTFPETLRGAGYRTFFAGKWHLGGVGSSPTDHGFEINQGGGANGHPRSYFAPYKNVENLAQGPEGEYLTSRLAAESIKFLDTVAPSGDPFLLYLSFYTPHTPLEAPEPIVEKYRQKAKKLGLDSDEGVLDESRLRQVWVNETEPRKVRVKQNHPVYAAMIEGLDTAVGEVLTRLDSLNLRDRTVIVFLSDNGGLSTSEGSPTSNLPLRAGKGWAYEGGLRIPMAIRWPGVTPGGTRCPIPLVTSDLYPTLLEMAGLPAMPEQHADGMSFAPLLRNPFAKFERGPLFFHYPHYGNQGGFPSSAMRDGDYTLIQDLEDGVYELYNLSTDLGQHNNLEQLEAEKVKEMSAALDAWRREVKAAPLQKSSKSGAEPPVLW